MSNVGKQYWCQITSHKKEYWGVLYIDILFFWNKIAREKQTFCNAKTKANAANGFQDDFYLYNLDAGISKWPLKCLAKRITIMWHKS